MARSKSSRQETAADVPQPPVPSQTALEIPARGALHKILTWIRSRWAGRLSFAAVVVGGFVAVGHFLGGVIGWWHAYELTFRHGADTKPHTALTTDGAAALPEAAPALSVAIEPFFSTQDELALHAVAETLGRHFATALSLSMFKVVPPARSIGVGATQVAAPPRDANTRYRVQGEVSREAGKVSVSVRVLTVATGVQVAVKQGAFEEADLGVTLTPPMYRFLMSVGGGIARADTQLALKKPESDLSPVELVLVARDAYSKDHTLRGVRAGQRLADRALSLDPNLSAVWELKAMLVNMEGDVDPRQDRERIGREQDQFSLKAVVTGASSGSAWSTRSTALAYLSRWDGAIEAASRAMELEPYSTEHRLQYAWLRGLMGRPEESIAIAEEVLRVDPAATPSAMRTMCEAYVLAGNFSAAIPACEKSNLLFADWISKLYLLAAYANNGEREKAAALQAQVLHEVPGYSIEQLRAKRYSDHPDYLPLAESNWYSGLRKAGINEL